MAEEDKKPKVELIKHARNDAEKAPDSQTKPPELEHRKVVVVKKKPGPVSPVNKKPAQPRVVSVQVQEAAKPEESKAEAEKTEKPVPEKAPVEKPFLPITKRPAGAAGKVGGRPVGNDVSPFAQRPAGVAGKVGGRFVGNRSGERPQGKPYQGGGGYRTGPGQQRQGPVSRPFTPRQPGQAKPPLRSGTGGFTPPPAGQGKTAVKKIFKAKKTVYQRKEQEMEEKLLQTKKKIPG